MSKSAGTLITTNNATYIPPRFMPGYRGHVPTMKFDYGETYGGHSVKYFQDFRSKALETSKTNYCKGGYFPTFYSYNPDMAISARSRKWDRWLNEPRYTLTTKDHDKKEEQIKFDKRAKAHREFYKDKSGEAHRVDYFVLPKKAEDQFKEHLPLEEAVACDIQNIALQNELISQSKGLVLSTRYTDDINIPDTDHIARRPPLQRSFTVTGSSQRDRAMRDVHFEKR